MVGHRAGQNHRGAPGETEPERCFGRVDGMESSHNEVDSSAAIATSAALLAHRSSIPTGLGWLAVVVAFAPVACPPSPSRAGLSEPATTTGRPESPLDSAQPNTSTVSAAPESEFVEFFWSAGDAAISRRVATLVSECMAERGFDYPILDFNEMSVDPAPSDSYGVAQRYIGGDDAGTESSGDTDPYIDAVSVVLNSVDPSELDAFTAALYGVVGRSADGEQTWGHRRSGTTGMRGVGEPERPARDTALRRDVCPDPRRLLPPAGQRSQHGDRDRRVAGLCR